MNFAAEHVDAAYSQKIERARRSFFLDGRLPAGLLPPHLAASWQRCRSVGLDSASRPHLEPILDRELRILLERDHRLTRSAREEMRHLSQAMADTGHVVVLINTEGFIVASGGDVSHAGPIMKHARSGIDLREVHFGTTAPIATLLERRPIHMRHGEHFLSQLQQLDCLAVPILLPDGNLLGAINVSCDVGLLMPGLVDLLQSSVNRIERLLLDELKSPFMLRLHPHPGCLGTALEGLIALGADDEILGLNSLAARVLGVTQAEAVGRPLTDWVEHRPQRSLPRRDLLTLRAKAGINLYAALTPARDHGHAHPLHTLPAQESVHSESGERELRLVEALTDREKEMLEFLTDGISNREMSQRLFISENTVKYHLKNIFTKLAVKSRLQAISTARALGLVR